MITWGISANSHDAALAVFDTENGSTELVFASHAERFSRIKNDPNLHKNWGMFSYGLINYAEDTWGKPDEVVWYEKPFKKTLRQFRAGQGWLARENNVKTYLGQYGIGNVPVHTVDHHFSHGAAGYYTSGFSDATIMVIDGIGESETLTMWRGQGATLKRFFSQKYPHSVGLWYSAMTQRIGLKPNEDEYILMGMAAYGDPERFYRDLIKDFIKKWPTPDDPRILFNHNLHRGCTWWKPELWSEQDYFDIAAATQKVYEEIFEYLLQAAAIISDSDNLVLQGGCALNCSANGLAQKYFKNVWIMPNPGDAGNAMGAVLAHRQQHIEWTGPYLGFNIEGDYPVEKIIQELKTNGICGVANGRAEFGPRALGNRSLLADPRGTDIKDRVNTIKRRQKFRPFAPAILAEHAQQYFDGPVGPYMQYTARCRYPELYPAIVHADGTSRVQTVTTADNPGFRKLLERWYAETGCPMLLNTSLNIKGQPMVNTVADGQDFSKKYNVKVY